MHYYKMQAHSNLEKFQNVAKTCNLPAARFARGCEHCKLKSITQILLLENSGGCCCFVRAAMTEHAEIHLPRLAPVLLPSPI
jgi:Ni2+-binding GTPase involved in maturation of urease and hydrogenase